MRIRYLDVSMLVAALALAACDSGGDVADGAVVQDGAAGMGGEAGAGGQGGDVVDMGGGEGGAAGMGGGAGGEGGAAGMGGEGGAAGMGGEGGGGQGGDAGAGGAVIEQATVRGVVLDVEGDPLAGATILAGDATTASDANGAFTLQIPADGTTIVEASRDGYALGSRPLTPGDAAEVSVSFTLYAVTVTRVDLSEGVAEVAVTNAAGAPVGWLTIPEGSVVDRETGMPVAGPVDVAIAHVAPEEAAAGKAPLPMETADGPMVSYGMTEVTVTTPDGADCNVAEGDALTLGTAATGAPEEPIEVPLWYYDEEQGMWVQQGTATRDGDTWNASLPHLTWWNNDTVQRLPTGPNLCCQIIEVRAPNGNPLPGADLQYYPASGGYLLRTAGADGNACLPAACGTAPSVGVVINLRGRHVTNFHPPALDVSNVNAGVACGAGDCQRSVLTVNCVADVPELACPAGQVCSAEGRCAPAACVPNCAPDACGEDGCGGTCGCDDNNGCTTDTCADGTCSHIACNSGRVAWNDLRAVPGQATPAAPYRFNIPVAIPGGDPVNVEVAFSRADGAPNIQSFTPGATRDGSFEAPSLAGIEFGWIGTFPYIDVVGDTRGTLRFDFGGTANDRVGRLGTWRYVMGMGGTSGGDNEGLTQVVASHDLALIGRFDAFGTGLYPTFQPPRTINGSAASPNPDGLLFFLLPENATDLVLALQAPGFDPHGYVVGIVNMNVAGCSGEGPAARCGNICGDGLPREGEACDDGNDMNGDGCSRNCLIEEGFTCTAPVASSICDRCGNGIRALGESCDDHNNVAGDGCSATCRSEDGYVCLGEVCTDCDMPGGMPDADADGVRDVCDVCPNDAMRQSFNWVTWNPDEPAAPPPGALRFNGTVGGVAVNFASQYVGNPLRPTRRVMGAVEAQAGTFDTAAHLGFPRDGREFIRNASVSRNTVTFGREVTNPLFAFASIGAPRQPVDVVFEQDIELVWTMPTVPRMFNAATVGADGRTLRGESTWAIVRVRGNHRSVDFRYSVAENSCDFAFGFGGEDTDFDGDGAPDACE